MLVRAGLRAGAAPLLPAHVFQQGAPLAAATAAAGASQEPIGASWRPLRNAQELQAAAAAPRAGGTQPVLDIAGGGMWWFWKVGAVHHLQQHYDLSRVQLHGSSSGAIVAVLAACGVDLSSAAQHTAQVLEEHRVHDRWVQLVVCCCVSTCRLYV